MLTHVPPFREGCWHEGRISDDDWFPHFACNSVGDRLQDVMRAHTDGTMTILCGHTHNSGRADILSHLTVFTGHAQYGEPEIQQVFEIE